MTVVQNTVELPGQEAARTEVDIRVVRYPAFDNDTDIEIGGRRVFIAGDGTWEADLVPNSQIDPEGTAYLVIQRPHGATKQVTHRVIVPDGGGPYQVHEILAEPLDAIPTTAASNLIISATSENQHDNLSVASGFVMTAVPETVVTVAPQAFRTELRGILSLRHDTVNSANAAAMIAPPGHTIVGPQIGVGYVNLGVSGIAGTGTARVQARLDPLAAGDYQLYVWSGAGSGTVTVATGADLALYRI